MKRNFLFFAIVAVWGAAATFYILREPALENISMTPRVCFESRCFYVEIAETASERMRGLMFRKSLPANRGMLFVFSRVGLYSFWMKNTYIPLDIVWIDEDKRIVFIKKNAPPCQSEECPSIHPGQIARYVLEVNAGITDSISLNLGDTAEFIDIEIF